MPADIRLTADEHNRLTTLTRRTGIKHRNVLLRWAFCRSLGEPNRVAPMNLQPDPSSAPIAWETFAGNYGDVIWGLLRMRCHGEGLPLDDVTLAAQFRLHLYRGLGYLAGDPSITDIAGLISLVTSTSELAEDGTLFPIEETR